MPDEQPISQQPPESAAPQATQTLVHEPPAEPGDWLPDEEELPARPRRRLLAPLPLSLLGLLLIACGFIGGVLVEKGQGSGASSSGAGSGAGLAARFAALRAGSGGGSATATGGAGLSAGSGGPGGAGGATVGQVSFISSGTLYVTTAEGNTVKVTPSPGATIAKTVKSDVKGIHPGETVVVTGAANATGAVSAESIRASASVAGGGGLGALLGGGGGGGGGAGGKSGSGAGGGPVLFGPGG